MNMKKTIAAIAAGAVAVSAMATTVSAITLDSRTLTYNLVKSTKNDDATVTITATFPNIALVEGDDIKVKVLGYTWGDEITIRGNYLEEGHQVVQITATENTWSDKFNSATVNDAANSNPNGLDWKGEIVIPVVEVNSANKIAFEAGSTGTASGAHASAELDGTAISLTNPDDLDTKIPADKSYVFITVAQINTALAAAGVQDGSSGAVTVTDTALAGWYDASTVANAGALVTAAIGRTGATMKGSDNAANTVSAVTSDLKAAATATTSAALSTALGVTVTDGATLDLTASTYTVTGAEQLHANITVEVKKTKLSQKNISEVNDALKAGTLGITLKNGGATAIVGASTASNFGGNGVTKHPFRSTLAGSDNVITSVHNTDDQSSLVSSTAIMAVINDAVANYSDVTFTFNTAAKNVKVFWAIDASDGNKKKFVDAQYTDDSTADLKSDGTWGATDYNGDWNGDVKMVEVVDCKAFGRHWWNDAPGYDPNTIYITQDWLNNNLFEGALIVNGGLTLSLKDTAKFDWTATSLTFTWDAIQDTALTKNQYANYIQTMVLKTSADWYWDNFQVTLGETEVEEVESGAPVEGDVEDLPEDEEETDLGDVDEPEEEEEEEESEPAPEVAPAVESNPGTGNAPVALAVIPVALAAAAIVAKKRG